jgi:hypothetical protein
MIKIKDPMINNCNSPNTLSCNIEEINKEWFHKEKDKKDRLLNKMIDYMIINNSIHNHKFNQLTSHKFLKKNFKINKVIHSVV